MKKVLLALLLAAVTGCAGTSRPAPLTGLTGESIAASEYAYVLIGNAGFSNEWLHTGKRFNERHTAEESFRTFSDSTSTGVIPRYQLYQVLPGRYTMIESGGLNVSRDLKKYNEDIKETDSLIAAFYAEKGKITYVGTFHFSKSTDKFVFNIDNNVGEAKAYIHNTYPQLDPATVQVYLAESGKAFGW